MSFQWDDANEGHIARHGVEPAEAEDALSDPDAVPAFARPANDGEWRGALVGQTEDGRYLTVIFTYRADLIRVVTARDATDTEKRRYRR
ncbi:BrnT family toxin [Deinococcus koreensis]|uniref:BrnT family toxin n=1 Tax=Deinococcus koreensis TaxID=2054903 RepID=A0A2K3UXL5_9DEIO|nr:BrnT family toxin [Deinococcus koreensis]PNY81271.1 BrnT family toxin [Deinococcus koreensis]